MPPAPCPREPAACVLNQWNAEWGASSPNRVSHVLSGPVACTAARVPNRNASPVEEGTVGEVGKSGSTEEEDVTLRLGRVLPVAPPVVEPCEDNVAARRHDTRGETAGTATVGGLLAVLLSVGAARAWPGAAAGSPAAGHRDRNMNPSSLWSPQLPVR